MKKIILLLMTLACTIITKADERMLQVWQTDGQMLSISLNDEPRTTYVDGNLVITTTKATITLPLEKVRRYTYTPEANGINTAQMTNASFSTNGETLSLSGLKLGTEVLLYNAAGQLLQRLTANQSGKLTISVSSRPTGVYIIKANDVTYKITKR